jgi:hypothetical protein
MQLTGHLTRSVFDRYNIVSESDLVTAASRLDAFFSQQGQKGTVRPHRPSRRSKVAEKLREIGGAARN